MSHSNNGKCEKCKEILDKYPNFNSDLRTWFEFFQLKHPEGHLSCAGRGYNEQTEAFHKGTSKAKYGQSAHNYNCAIDLFVSAPLLDIYDRAWFANAVSPAIPESLCWYGHPGSEFFELPHVEIRNWKDLREQNSIKLVEELHE